MLSATTELEAVNSMLTTIGEAPVSSLENNGIADAAIAFQILQETSREVQARGWHFNTEVEFPLSPTFPEKTIVLPQNVLEVDTAGVDGYIEAVQRGNRLYNRKKNTYQFDRTVKVDMIIQLPFEDLPEYAKGYIAVRAARIFQRRVVGSAELDSYTAQHEVRMLVQMENAEARTADLNVFNDNESILRVLNR